MSTPCYYYGTPQGCRFGSSCRFSHGCQTATKPTNDNYSAPLCRFFGTSSGCRAGTGCRYRHEQSQIAAIESAEAEEAKPAEDPPQADIDDELIVAGFLRDLLKEQETKTVGESEDTSSLPEGLNKLCQSFYSVIIKWDESSKWYNDNMHLVDSGNCISMKSTGWGSAFLTEEYSEGLHHWKFKLQSLDARRRYYVLFGIWKSESGSAILDSFFTDQKDNGYAMNVIDGTLTVPRMPGCGGIKYATYCKTGDVIDMYLDFDELLLTFAINGKYYPKGQKVEDTTYKAAVTMYWQKDTIRFISHDNKPFGS